MSFYIKKLLLLSSVLFSTQIFGGEPTALPPRGSQILYVIPAKEKINNFATAATTKFIIEGGDIWEISHYGNSENAMRSISEGDYVSLENGKAICEEKRISLSVERFGSVDLDHPITLESTSIFVLEPTFLNDQVAMATLDSNGGFIEEIEVCFGPELTAEGFNEVQMPSTLLAWKEGAVVYIGRESYAEQIDTVEGLLVNLEQREITAGDLIPERDIQNPILISANENELILNEGAAWKPVPCFNTLSTCGNGLKVPVRVTRLDALLNDIKELLNSGDDDVIEFLFEELLPLLDHLEVSMVEAVQWLHANRNILQLALITNLETNETALYWNLDAK
jgi:hypothetical protein